MGPGCLKVDDTCTVFDVKMSQILPDLRAHFHDHMIKINLVYLKIDFKQQTFLLNTISCKFIIYFVHIPTYGYSLMNLFLCREFAVQHGQ